MRGRQERKERSDGYTQKERNKRKGKPECFRGKGRAKKVIAVIHVALSTSASTIRTPGRCEDYIEHTGSIFFSPGVTVDPKKKKSIWIWMSIYPRQRLPAFLLVEFELTMPLTISSRTEDERSKRLYCGGFVVSPHVPIGPNTIRYDTIWGY